MLKKNNTTPPKNTSKTFLILLDEIESFRIEVHEIIKERRERMERKQREQSNDLEFFDILIITAVLVTCSMFSLLLAINICERLFS